MIADAPFLLAISGLNASFAGLGGLLIGLRRGADLRPLDSLRLRQVVEFAFVNLIVAISAQPFALVLGAPEAGLRVSGGLALAYNLVALPVLQRRVARVGIAWGRWWAVSAVALTVGGTLLSASVVVLPSAGLFELLAIVMLARPMVTFLLVLGTIETPEPVTSQVQRPSPSRSSRSPSPSPRSGTVSGGRGGACSPATPSPSSER